MPQSEVLVCKAPGAVNACRTSAVTIEKVAALAHEVFDHAVELAALVAERAALRVLGLASAKLTEVLCSPRGDVGKELHFDAAKRFA